MIRYVLRCDDNHKFEAWFRSRADCERLTRRGEASCPLCDGALPDEIVPAPPQANLTDRAAGLTSARRFKRPTEH